MTNEQRIKNNRLIAEFMGGVINPKWRDVVTYKFEIAPTPHSAYNWALEEMEYRISWDWLMPVVERIHSHTDAWVTIRYCECEIFDSIAPERFEKIVFNEENSENTLNAIYQAIVKFIEWHNINDIS